MTISELYKKIELIEMSPSSVVGGSKAFFSGRKTELTSKAKAAISKLQKQIDAMSDHLDE